MIVVEGADNVGKTTLVKRLLERDPELKLLKRSRSNASKDRTIGASYIQALIPRDGDFIRHGYSVADRLLASECIYGDLYRGGCRMSDEEHQTIRHLLDSYQALIVHCDVPDDRILDSWSERGQLYNDPLAVARMYRERITHIFKRPVIVYDWTAADADERFHHLVAVHSYIQEELKKDKDRYNSLLRQITLPRPR